jgi:hypothetical protein
MKVSVSFVKEDKVKLPWYKRLLHYLFPFYLRGYFIPKSIQWLEKPDFKIESSAGVNYDFSVEEKKSGMYTITIENDIPTLKIYQND